VQAAFAVNRELILLYWSIGRDLSQRFAAEDWGGKIIDRLAQDLQNEFPGVEGFSPRNLRYMGTAQETEFYVRVYFGFVADRSYAGLTDRA
jgi:hypothetical protein